MEDYELFPLNYNDPSDPSLFPSLVGKPDQGGWQNYKPQPGLNVVNTLVNGQPTQGYQLDPSVDPTKNLDISYARGNDLAVLTDPADIAARRADERTRNTQAAVKIAAMIGGAAWLSNTAWSTGTQTATHTATATDAAFGSVAPETASGVSAAVQAPIDLFPAGAPATLAGAGGGGGTALATAATNVVNAGTAGLTAGIGGAAGAVPALATAAAPAAAAPAAPFTATDAASIYGGGANPAGATFFTKVGTFLTANKDIIGSVLAGIGQATAAADAEKEILQERQRLTAANYHGTNPAVGYRALMPDTQTQTPDQRFGRRDQGGFTLQLDPTTHRMKRIPVTPTNQARA